MAFIHSTGIKIYSQQIIQVTLSAQKMVSTQSLCYMIIYWHHFAGGKGNGITIGQSVDTADGSSDQCSNSKATKEIQLFTVEEKTKFICRYEEGYDLIVSDSHYKAWLEMKHPRVTVTLIPW